MKKALVTGGCGFVGGALIGQLLDLGVEVAALDLPRLEDRFAYKGKARFIGADITDPESLARALDRDIDCVFHTAALFKYGVPREIIRKVNVEGTRVLCEALLHKGISRIINWGSSTVYGFWDDSKFIKDEACPVREEDLTETYAWSKREQEKIGETFAAKGLKVTTIRPGDIYGPGTPNGMALPLYYFKIGLMRSVPGFREVFVSHVHVDDVAGAAIHLAKTPESAGQIYNIADAAPLSNFEIFELVSKIFNTWYLPPRTKTFDIPVFHTHPAILKLSGLIEEWRAKMKGVYPRYDRHSSGYMAKNHILSNRKLLATGYKLKWPDCRDALAPLIEWYEKTNWAIVKG
ncbi:MAG: NAD(P)-dependent oxidoreductase [Elusimicrobiota bacterium]